MANQRQIFISYAREDKEQKEKVFDLLVDNLNLNHFIPWKDDMIPAGQYEKTIAQEIRRSDFYILLISKSFMNSEFIRKNELPLMLEKSTADKIIIPIILADYTKEELAKALPEIANFQFFPKKQENLSLFENADHAYASLTNDLLKSFNKESGKWRRIALIIAGIFIGAFAIFMGFQFFKPTVECPAFIKDVDVKTLIFPVDKNNDAINKILDDRFAKTCSRYNIKSDNRFFNIKKSLSTGDQIQHAKNCNSDLLLSGTIINVNNQDFFEGFFQFINDSINLYRPSYQTFDNALQAIPLIELIESKKLNESFDQLVLNIVGFLAYKKGDNKNTILAIKESRIDTIRNKAFKLSAYKVLADAYLQNGQLDSSISCLNKMNKWFPQNADILLKKSILATKAGRSDVAIDAYTQLLKFDTVHKVAILEKRGKLFERVKDYDNAKKDFDEIKVLNKRPITKNVHKLNTEKVIRR